VREIYRRVESIKWEADVPPDLKIDPVKFWGGMGYKLLPPEKDLGWQL
jgi:hypothetical protein